MMMNATSDNLYLDNASSDTLFDFTHNDQQSVILEEEYNNVSTLDETNEEQLQILSIHNLSTLICSVCGASAVGCNFDKITCEPCKAFFRRNAFRDMTTMKCRCEGSGIIDIQTRRHCAYCRLKKCFDIKMRKDWIRTDEEVELRQLKKLAKEQKKLNKLADEQEYLLNLPLVARKKKRLPKKPTTQELVIQSIFEYSLILSDDDRIIINNITNCYQSVTDHIDTFRLKCWTSPQCLTEFINQENPMHSSLIQFYKSIPHFNELDINDRMLLIKWNLVKIVHIHCIIMHQFEENPLIGFYMSKWISPDFHNQMSRILRQFNRFMGHPLVLKLVLVVFIFSTNLSAVDSVDPSDDYINQSQISAIQNFYTTILWSYLTSVYDEKEAIRSMEIIMTQILHFQILMTILEESLQREKVYYPINELESCIFRLK